MNVLASDFHGAVTRRLGRAKHVIRNPDLTRVVGKAIASVIRQSADEPKLTADQSALRALAEAAPAYWETLAPLTATDEALAPLSDAELTGFVAVPAEEFGSLTALDPKTWENFVRALADVKAITLHSATFPRIASELHLSFLTAAPRGC